MNAGVQVLRCNSSFHDRDVCVSERSVASSTSDISVSGDKLQVFQAKLRTENTNVVAQNLVLVAQNLTVGTQNPAVDAQNPTLAVAKGNGEVETREAEASNLTVKPQLPAHGTGKDNAAAPSRTDGVTGDSYSRDNARNKRVAH